jgi:hypothetical protein
MAVCQVDVMPESLYGISCGRLITDGKCPVHGEVTDPSVLDHPVPTSYQIASALCSFDEALSG